MQRTCLQYNCSFRSHRCPTECRLTWSQQPWQCAVSLRFVTDARGQALGTARNEPFGDVIFNKAMVEERIRRAQRAALNPGTSPSHFLHAADEDPAAPELSFTNNCVCLQIRGGDVADLSFCDLPGMCRACVSVCCGWVVC